MKKEHKISIIIPIYNVESYIAECLQSVMRQTYTGEIECILVDDCGTDNSIAVAEKVIEDYIIKNQKSKIKNQKSFCILHHEHNRGLSAARNTGTDAAIGDYIYYLDSDDYISDDCIEVLARPLKEFSYDLVIGNLDTFGGERSFRPLLYPSGEILSNSAISDAFYGKMPIYTMVWNKLIKADLFKKHDLSFWEGQLDEDEIWTYKCCRIIESIYIQNIVTYHYRIRTDSIMGKSIETAKRFAQSYSLYVDYILSLPSNINQEMNNKILLSFINGYISYSLTAEKNFCQEYIAIRKRFDYRPLSRWRNGILSLKDVKHQFHYVLPPALGYIYLKTRWLKNKFVTQVKNYT